MKRISLLLLVLALLAAAAPRCRAQADDAADEGG
jgi:hypothetical protein